MSSRSTTYRFLISLLVLLPATSAYAQDDSNRDATLAGMSRTAVAVLVDEAPVLDGVLDEAVWAEADPITDFLQLEPVEFSQINQH